MLSFMSRGAEGYFLCAQGPKTADARRRVRERCIVVVECGRVKREPGKLARVAPRGESHGTRLTLGAPRVTPKRKRSAGPG